MLVSENIGKGFFVPLSDNKRLNRMNKSQILDCIAFYKMSQPFLIWGCITCKARAELLCVSEKHSVFPFWMNLCFWAKSIWWTNDSMAHLWRETFTLL